jgi:hypothetical protein
MPTKSTWRDVKTQLEYLDQAQLIELLRKMWQDLPESKLYLINAVTPGADISAEVERYRKIIKDRFFPTRGVGDMKLNRARKAISDFAKSHPPPVALAELMLFYVEQGVAFTREYGDIDEPFYNSLVTMFESLVALIEKHGMEIYGPLGARIEQLRRASRGFGWGFSDEMSELFDRMDAAIGRSQA